MVNIDTNAQYYIVNIRSGTYMTVSDVDNVSIIGQQYTQFDDTQVWTFQSADTPGTYYIQSVAQKCYLAVPVAEIMDGLQLQALSDQYQWQIQDVPNIAIAANIKMVTANMYVDLSNGSSEDGAHVQLWGPTSGDYVNDQVWALQRV